jgi:hypothetical protein
MPAWLQRWQERRDARWEARITRAWLRELEGDREVLEEHFTFTDEGGGITTMTPKADSAPTAPVALPEALERWLTNADGDSLARAADITAIRAHDPACDSLKHVWLARRGGYSDMCEIEDCPGCGIAFHIDGTHYEEDSAQLWLDEGDEEFYDANWCTCCWTAWKATPVIGPKIPTLEESP